MLRQSSQTQDSRTTKQKSTLSGDSPRTTNTQLAANTAQINANKVAEQQRVEQEAKQRKDQEIKQRKDQEIKQRKEQDARQEQLRQQNAKEQAARDTQEKAEQVKKDGCYVPVRSPQPCVFAEEPRWSKDNFRVVFRNNCEARVYIHYCIMQKDGGATCGADGAVQGGAVSGDAYSATGTYAYKFTGSRKPASDWVCGNADRDAEFHAHNLKSELGAR